MRRICIYLIINCLWLPSLFAQHLNQVITDTTLHTDILIDTCNRDGLAGPVFGAFYQLEYASYLPDAGIIQQIAQQLNNHNLTIVMGSWCSDSQEQVPRMYKILDQLHFPGNQVTLICVDRKKKTIRAGIQDLNIQLVPTFIFYKGCTEAGRITETPSETLEKDILGIIQTLNNE